MASKKWQAKRRVRNNLRRKAKRLAAAAAQPSTTPALPGQLSTDEGTKSSPLVNNSGKVPKKPQTSPGPRQKPNTKPITPRERLRLLEKTVVWLHEAASREGSSLRNKVQRAEQQISLLLAERAELKRDRQEDVETRVEEQEWNSGV